VCLPEHLRRFVAANAAGKVALLCHSLGVRGQRRVDRYTHAVRDAVLAMAKERSPSVAQVDAFLDTQVTLLAGALRSVAPAPGRPAGMAPPPDADAARPRTRGNPGSPRGGAAEAKSMELKLEEARRPLRKILQLDCVQLGLLTTQRAKQLAIHLPGKLRQDAEAELVAELRNNLHAQLRTYMREHQGGPWSCPKLQDEVRLDIAQTASVHGVVKLTRQLLQERKEWEEKLKKGLFQNLLGGRLSLSPPGPKKS
jgi:hypothetical protein